jgi:uncharacterized protein (UPF0335 family)
MMNARLHEICERIARLERERKELAAEIAQIKKDAKDEGYDTALITKTVRVMNLSPKKRQEALEQHELFDSYLSAAGLLPAFEANKQGEEGEPATQAAPATPHDAETGEIRDETPAAAVSSAAGEEGGGSPPVAPPSTFSDLGQIPPFLDRRQPQHEGAVTW